MTSDEARVLRFLLRYPLSWHGFALSMTKTVKRLENHGLIVVCRHGPRDMQVKLALPCSDYLQSQEGS